MMLISVMLQKQYRCFELSKQPPVKLRLSIRMRINEHFLLLIGCGDAISQTSCACAQSFVWVWKVVICTFTMGLFFLKTLTSRVARRIELTPCPCGLRKRPQYIHLVVVPYQLDSRFLAFFVKRKRRPFLVYFRIFVPQHSLIYSFTHIHTLSISVLSHAHFCRYHIHFYNSIASSHFQVTNSITREESRP